MQFLWGMTEHYTSNWERTYTHTLDWCLELGWNRYGIQLWKRCQCLWTLYKTDTCKQVLSWFRSNTYTYCKNMGNFRLWAWPVVPKFACYFANNFLKTVWKATSLVWLENIWKCNPQHASSLVTRSFPMSDIEKLARGIFECMQPSSTYPT